MVTVGNFACLTFAIVEILNDLNEITGRSLKGSQSGGAERR